MRNHTQAIVDRLPTSTPLIGAEVGVFGGTNAIGLLEALPDLFLFLVDPYKEFPANHRFTRVFGGPTPNLPTKWTQARYDKTYKGTIIRLKPYKDRYTMLRMESLEGAKKIIAGTLDFVFIDGDHTEEGCTEDILAWKSKVKPGGLLCGHDFGRWGVAEAVIKTLGPKGYELGDDTTWFVTI
jgi:predicted O-methyltransferase YrrM